MTDRDEPRPGEIVSPGPLAGDAELTFIGWIETPWQDRAHCPRRGDAVSGPLCRLHVAPRWVPALEGVDAYAELQVLYWMDDARRDLVRLVPHGGAPRGPFALRAPTRPNPIASSIVRLVGREAGILMVRGLDCRSGTPLLDIKPWRGAAAAEG